MDHDLLESISKALQKLQKEQAVLSNKLIKIAEVCKNKFIKVEREQTEKFQFYEKKLEELEIKEVNKQTTIEVKLNTLSEDIETLKKEEVELSDDVSELEAKQKQVDDKLSLIDQTLEEIKDKLEVSDKSDECKLDDRDKYIRKPCIFHSRGNCREGESCPFLHADKVCEIYKERGVCWKQVCRQRHPKTCWYGKRCFRGESFFIIL
jgi:hypothetical protein